MNLMDVEYDGLTVPDMSLSRFPEGMSRFVRSRRISENLKWKRQAIAFHSGRTNRECYGRSASAK